MLYFTERWFWRVSDAVTGNWPPVLQWLALPIVATVFCLAAMIEIPLRNLFRADNWRRPRR